MFSYHGSDSCIITWVFVYGVWHVSSSAFMYLNVYLNLIDVILRLENVNNYILQLAPTFATIGTI